jgi:hypothetical protein
MQQPCAVVGTLGRVGGPTRAAAQNDQGQRQPKPETCALDSARARPGRNLAQMGSVAGRGPHSVALAKPFSIRALEGRVTASV